MEKLTDERIVDLFLERKEQAIHETEKKYGRYLLTTAKNILGDEEDSRECVNDALFQLWTHIPPDCPKSSFKAYISRVARNRAIDRAKEQGRKKRVPSEFIASLDELSEYLEDAENVEKEYDGILLKECLNRFIRSLSKRKRTIFIGRFHFFYSVSEIAKTLGCSERTVFSELAEMKRKLKDKLRKEGFYND